MSKQVKCKLCGIAFTPLNDKSQVCSSTCLLLFKDGRYTKREQ